MQKGVFSYPPMMASGTRMNDYGELEPLEPDEKRIKIADTSQIDHTAI